MHTFRSLYHYAASVNTSESVLHVSVIRVIFNRPFSPRSRHLRLVADIRRGTSRAARAGHDIAGPGLHSGLEVPPGPQLHGPGLHLEVSGWPQSRCRLTEARLRNIGRLLLAG